MGANVSSADGFQSSNTLEPSGNSGDTVLSETSALACLQPFLLSGVEDRNRELGRGAYAIVREMEVKGKRCAGKKLHKTLYEFASDEERQRMLSRFANECQLLQSVKHPNIVRFLGVHLEKGSQLPYLVMELLYSTLAGYLEKHGVPDAPTYYNILSDVALGLRYLHQQSPPIIHRDLSANNVLLSSSLQAKISDLGVAKVLNISPTQKSRMTQTAGHGTPCYMPPEALVERPKYSTAIDCFSFGILMIHTLCGDWPAPDAPTCVNPSNPDVIIAVTEFDRRKSYIDTVGYNHPLMDLIRRCLDNNPSSRPDMSTVVTEVVDIQFQTNGGKVYYPRITYESSGEHELAVSIGEDVRVYGAGHKLLKVFSVSQYQMGYVPSDVLRQLHQCPLAIALYDYHSDAEDSLSLAKGDTVHVLSMENEDWWYAYSRSSRKQGFIPSNYASEHSKGYRWYLGNTSHSEADNLLKDAHNSYGSFLIHDECQDVRCLSLRGRDSIMHYQIQSCDGAVYIVKEDTFKTLQDLVHHYSQHAGVLCTKLKHPYHVVRGDDEVDRSQVKLVHKMRVEQFGEVWKGLKGKTHVVVRTLTSGTTSASDFLEQASFITQLNHPSIIQCLGVCTKEEPIYVLMEYMRYGNLQEYLSKGEGKEVHFLDLVHMAVQVAGGMAYLEQLSYIHCDLAARSVLVGEGKVCKIANFTKARRADVYKLPPRTQVPIRWTAPEVFSTNEYTIKSDVWSFGILLHEIVTRGARPYSHMTNEETLKAIQSGYRMPQPEGCPQGVYDMMLKCWQTDPSSRLRFEAIEWQLEEFFISKCFEDKTYIAPFQIKH